jgi:hypothetical protein
MGIKFPTLVRDFWRGNLSIVGALLVQGPVDNEQDNSIEELEDDQGGQCFQQ